jgi:hypothetical protein
LQYGVPDRSTLGPWRSRDGDGIFWIIEQCRRFDGRPDRTPEEDKVADATKRQLCNDCVLETDPPRFSSDGKIPNGKIMTGRESELPFTMLWLPWATLAALELMSTSPNSGAVNESLVRTLIRELAREGTTMNVANFYFQSDGYLLAMSEVLMKLEQLP